MPSRHRIRNTSSANHASQTFFNIKAGLVASQSTTEALSSSSVASSVVSDTNNSYINKKLIGQNNKKILNGHLNNNSGHQISGSGDGWNPQDEKKIRNAYLNTLTKEQLKVECRKRGQKTNGNRFDLLQRLGVKLSQIQKKGTAEVSTNFQNTNKMEVSKKSQKKSNGISPSKSTTNFPKDSIKKLSKEKQRVERESLVLWRSPIKTTKFCSLELITLIQTYGKKLFYQQAILAGILVLIGILSIFYNVPGRHQIVIEMIQKNTWFFVYWIGLGVLSSVGLGTGLHTFLLYLGPHIASVTLAAYECNALNFPKPPYPDDIICPDVPDTHSPNLWNIMTKVRLEAFLWGAGTALGELPPYFMAKAARLSGYDPEDAEDMAEFEALKKKKAEDLTMLDKGKLFMEKIVERVGFFGILACASVPNPLFDLAGITCGHFLVPFWTFFGATLIGKAIIKMHIQKIFVIIAFNESLIERAVDFLELVPVFGKKLQEPFKLFLENQKTRLHRHSNAKLPESGNLLSKIFEKFVIAMVCYFVVSIINSLAQSYYKRIHKSNKKTK